VRVRKEKDSFLLALVEENPGGGKGAPQKKKARENRSPPLSLALPKIKVRLFLPLSFGGGEGGGTGKEGESIPFSTFLDIVLKRGGGGLPTPLLSLLL